MLKKIFRKELLSAVGLFVLPSGSFAKAKTTNLNKQPNVLMIVVDDWGVNDLSLTGSKFYETPNVDALSGKSTFFNQAYVAYPRSVPSRFSLFTGMHCARPQDSKKSEADDREVGKDSYCIAEPFKAAGYETFFIGKWHLATKDCLPQDKGFDINIGGGKAGATSSYFYPFNKVRKQNHKVEKDIEGMDDATPNEYLTDYMNRKTVDYIKSNHKKPFFAVCSYYAVHTPLEAKADLIEKYTKKRERLGLNNDGFINEEAGERKVQQNNPIYAAMIESVDNGVGNIIKALKETGQYDNTIIVLISDHGGLSNRGAKNKREVATTNDPLKAGKGHLYEGGLKVPLMIHLPKQEKGVVSNELVASYDLLPTLTSLCKVEVKKDAILDGMNISQLLNVPTDNVSKTATRKMFWHKVAERPSSTGDYVSSAIRLGDYKLIDFYNQNRMELYNITSDPGERNNLIEKEPKTAQSLLRELSKWREELGVKMKNKEVDKEKKDKKGKKEKKQNRGEELSED